MNVLRAIAILVITSGTLVIADTAIEGRVELPKARHAPVANKRYEIVSSGGVLAPYPAFAVVYIEGNFPHPASLPVQQIVQKNLAFDTALLPVRLGTKIEFPNQDDTPHNIFSFSPTQRFDLGRYTANERPIPSQTFDKQGLVTLRCDIHEHMRALVLVLDTPHFVKTDNDGHFRLGGLPPGSYRLKAWIDSKTTIERPVEVKAGTTLRVDFP